MRNEFDRRARGPQFVDMFGPVLDALRHLGGSGRPNEVMEFITENEEIPEVWNEELSSGGTRFSKNVHWARFYLAKDGYIESHQRGVWTLTEKGRDAVMSHDEALDVFYRVQDGIRNSDVVESEGQEAQIEFDDASDPEYREHRAKVLRKLRTMSAAGFEKFCQLLLRMAGFEQVIVTGRTGDGGIDGHGIVKINQFVGFQVAFQSKRYGDGRTVGSRVVRDFRGAIMGRSDKGIIITTGTFTSDAQKEAVRDGATPIELVDGEQVLDMIEELELGVRKKTVVVFEVDEDFFRRFD